MAPIPNTPIIVDSFGFYPGCYIYLLTHLHAGNGKQFQISHLADHTSGLTPSWNLGTIYCSHVTRAILLEKFQLNAALVVGLDEDCTHNIPMDTQSNVKKNSVTMQATLIDANHCPGACMFLLEGYFGTILHTGDFRFDPLILEHEALINKKIDHLFCDDTFCSPEYDFPSRAEAGKEILDIIEHYSNKYQILIGVDTLGKEELLVAIALKFKTLIVVDEERMRMLSAMRTVIQDLPDVFTHDANMGRVHVLPKTQVSWKKIQACRLTRPTIGIQASGWAITALPKKSGEFQRMPIYRVAYSLHSSYSELETFVKALHPKKLYSVSRHDNAYINSRLGHLCSNEAVAPCIIPKAVQLCMEAKKLSVNSSSTLVKLRPQPKKPQHVKKPSPLKKKGAKIVSQPVGGDVIDLTDEANTPDENVYMIEDDPQLEVDQAFMAALQEEDSAVHGKGTFTANDLLEILGGLDADKACVLSQHNTLLEPASFTPDIVISDDIVQATPKADAQEAMYMDLFSYNPKNRTTTMEDTQQGASQSPATSRKRKSSPVKLQGSAEKKRKLTHVPTTQSLMAMPLSFNMQDLPSADDDFQNEPIDSMNISYEEAISAKVMPAPAKPAPPVPARNNKSSSQRTMQALRQASQQFSQQRNSSQGSKLVGSNSIILSSDNLDYMDDDMLQGNIFVDVEDATSTIDLLSSQQ